MLGNAKYKYITPACARSLALLVLLLWGAVAQGQGYFTLTNGRLWWSNGTVDQNDDDWKDPVAFDSSRFDARNNCVEVHPHGTSHVTNITEQGDTYLALDITDPEHPTIVSKAHNEFDLYCVWYRTDYTGYYYQEWYNDSDSKSYRYYIIANSDADELEIVRAEVGQPLTKSTYWYNWDFGAASWEKPKINGEIQNRYYWMMLQDRNRDNEATAINPPVWKLSHHTYQRPEDIYYTEYTGNAATDAANLRYYDGVSNGFTYYPAGNGALFMPVTKVVHEDSITAIARDSEDGDKPYGLQCTVSGKPYSAHTGIAARLTSMTFGSDDTNSVRAIMKYRNSNKVPMDLRPAYTEYIEETYRRGINLNYRYRNEEGVFGSAGIGTFRTHYYQGTNPLVTAPGPTSMEATVDTIIFAIESRSLRYLAVDTIYPMNSAKKGQAVLNYFAPCNGIDTAEVYVTVRYSNGAVQYDTLAIELLFTKSERIITKPTVGPVIRGAVFGGGRMANVGGSTVVVVHSADSINTIYGGNDIAGWVQGDDGATLQLGTEYTSKEHPAHIGNVYGGGNGYYVYRGINMSSITGYPYRYGSSLKYQNYYFGYHYNGHDGQPPVDTNWILNPRYPVNLPAEITSNPYYLGEGTAMYHNPITQKDTLTRYYVMRRNDFCGSVYEYGHVPQIKDGHTSSFSSYDSAFLDWGPLQEYLVDGTEDICFRYNPEIGDATSVDLSEQGLGGNGTIPYLKTAHITVGVPEGNTPFIRKNGSGADDSTHRYNDYVLIDTLFGGARNAFIGVSSNEEDHPENGVTIDINGGTMFAVFGGNNVGGSVANTSTVFINVNNTKLLPSDGEIEESFITGYGCDFGIRYLFGGGNLVDGSHANVLISGGMIDTAYLGGNNATVQNPIGTVDCRKQGSLNGFGYDGHFICTNTSYPHTVDFTDPVKTFDEHPEYFDGYGPDYFNPEEGNYNIRCLFGGNNAADMANLTTIQLHSGGISSVYGGGNVGDMANNSTYTVTGTFTAPASHPELAVLNGTKAGTGTHMPFSTPFYNFLFSRAFDVNINPVDGSEVSYKSGGWADVYGRLTMPSKVGTIVTALPDSKIVCDYVFGGSRIGNVKNSAGVYLAGGIYGYVTGGNDVSGDIGSETGGGVYLLLDSNALVVGDVVGGSDGYYHCDDGTGHYGDGDLYDSYASAGDEPYDPYDEFEGMLMPTHNNINFYLRGGLVMGQVVAGGAHADVGFSQRTNYINKMLHSGSREDTVIDLSTVGGALRGTVHFLARGGHVLGNGYGGGFQSKVHGLSYLTIGGNTRIDGSFFCGNDCTGSIRSFGAYMNPNDYQRHYAAYKEAGDSDSDADEKALIDSYKDMIATDSTALNEDNGDGTWSAATSVYLRLNDTPYVHCVYGSGNGAYDYDGTRPQYPSISHCPDPSGSVTPLQSSTFIDINTSGINSIARAGIDTVFGGGNGVGVEEKVVVLLNNETKDVHAVHTIFGGNNVDDMLDVVPEIRLLKGQVNTVFAGANNGVMGAKRSNEFKDVLGHAVANVSTHVRLNSKDVIIHDTLFGGSRMSDIKGNTFVVVLKTDDGGVNYIFGGNDISGNIDGMTRIDVSGGTVHNIFGGSNGRYDFVEIGDNEYAIYPFNSVPDDSANHRITIAGYPEIDSTNINIWGGTVGVDTGGVYGGGSMADCRSTNVVVNDTVEGTNGQATILGTVFGGGMGDYADLNNRNLRGERYGNVEEATHVHLYHAKELSSAKAYGGGRGGDVMNTYITTYEGWDSQLDSLFGGGWGADVHGTTHVTINGVNPGAGQYNVAHLFGGNDFSGDVYKTDVTVNSGHFNYIYGAGNGDYADSRYNSGVYKDDSTDVEHIVAHHIHRPNAEYVNLTFNAGEVDGNLYGGGKLGSTWAYEKDANRQYVIGAHGHKIPDTALTTAQAHADPKDYAYVIINIHGGEFHNNIYGGAAGSKELTHPLIYGLKVVNMDAGKVDMSLYGGSQSVDDGYPAECKNSSTTTKRPSSIVNITGGTIDNNIYGGGYLGLTYGSAYLNIGTDAIDSCVAYTQRYGNGGAKGAGDSVYWQFKPGEEGSLSDALDKTDLLLNRSVYVGSNWGNAGGTSDFTKPGFHGGESKIIIDGKGYNTDNNELNNDPEMNIAKSVFCAGTSVSGGDIAYSKKIDIWNYGSIVNCQPTRKLESIQRSDSLWFHNTAIEFTGAIDATSAYQSIPYSLKNIITACFRGYNVLEFDAVIEDVPQMHFFEEPLTDGSLAYVPIQNLRNHIGSGSCADTATSCSNLLVVDPETDGMQHTVFILNNGIDFEIASTSPKSPGGVSGFGYVFTPQGYNSTILATATASDGYSWIAPGYFDWSHDLGGFASPCDTTNKYTADRGLVDWQNSTTEEERLASEHPYTNYEGGGYGYYRVWEVGNGTRLRETTILAHTKPDSLDQNVHFRIKSDTNANMAVAEASIQLPATSTGHYYRLISGITLSSENETLNLIDSAFMPSQTFGYLDTLYHGKGFIDTSATFRQGKIAGTALDNLGVATGMQDIIDHPTNTFGLVMVPGEYFQGVPNGYFNVSDTNDFVMPTGAPKDSSLFVFTGNSHVTSFEQYITPKVVTGTALKPTMKFYLTYNTDFATALLGTAQFTLMEYDENGDEVAPIDVKVYISTIIEDFQPITTNVLAMYNAGRTNTFTRKVVLPATLEENRQLYLEKVYWVPTTINGEDAADSIRFYLVKNEASVTGAAELVNNLFALNVIPSEDLTSEMASNLGWSSINQPNINVYDLKTDPSHATAVRYSDSTGAKAPKAIDLTNDGETEGMLIGTLDGRGTAVLNMQLTFDGEREYPATKGKGYVGKVVFDMASRLSGGVRRFPITVYVKTRDEADTIYIASANSVTHGKTVYPYTSNEKYISAMSSGTQVEKDGALSQVGKSPNWYVHTFQEALSTKIYQEGDVLCILDTVKIDRGLDLSIHGGDGPAIEVIRYEGHHHELPGEAGVYRGPMIQISKSGSSFTATNIAFHGGSGAIIMDRTTNRPMGSTPVETFTNPDTCKYADTNCVFAPIFQVMDSGSLVLHEGSSVRHNWNAYGVDASHLDPYGLPKQTRDMGAISLTNNGSLTLRGNVDISQNLCHTYVGDRPTRPQYDAHHPYNGAVYVDGGKVILPEAKEGTAITLTKNWLVDTAIHTNPGTVNWWKEKTVNGTVVRWTFDESKVADWQKANVLLTRKAGVDDMHDTRSDMFVLTGTVAKDTRIGVRKWFPGLTERDTIRFSTAGGSNLSVLSKAVENENFVSDDNERIFYNALVNNNYIYLYRCATFRHQIAGVDLPLTNGGGTYASTDVLRYDPRLTSCPTGGDRLLYGIQGGFMPYTFTWDSAGGGANLRTRTSAYSNTRVERDLSVEGDTTTYYTSLYDTLTLANMNLAYNEGVGTIGYHVSATDATGGCHLYKDIQIIVDRTWDEVPPANVTYIKHDATTEQIADREDSEWKTTPTDGWTDTARVHKAIARRNYKSMHITPKVWVDRSSGTIAARVDGDDNDYIYTYDNEDNRHELEDVYLCEGDAVRLYAQPTYTGTTPNTHFIMWDFDPYYNNPSIHIMPPHNDTVVAYYGPNDYWNNAINSEAKAGAALTTTYYYEERPTVASYTTPAGASTQAGYVTTYDGDVHIYNENGLAWLISVVGGLNGQQIRPFYFDHVYLHEKSGGYDMKNYRWMPMGTLQYGFRGYLLAVGDNDTTTNPIDRFDTLKDGGGNIVYLEDGVTPKQVDTIYHSVTIKNIIVDEPDMDYVGFFSFLDSARVVGVDLKGVLARGSQYVGGLAAHSRGSRILQCGVGDETEGAATTSILTTHYVSGGMIGLSEGDTINGSTIKAKYVGSAVYSGGVVGRGTASRVENTHARNDSRMSGLYVGGLAGYLDGIAPTNSLFRAKRAGRPAVVANNYVYLTTNRNANRVGGLVGYASNAVIENNYVYGSVSGSSSEGAVAATLNRGAEASHNYYAAGTTTEVVGTRQGGAMVDQYASFEGSGNQVILADDIYGTDNLTRALNLWVREHNSAGHHYRTWRSDLLNTNDGYPYFGDPDLIPVHSTRLVEACEAAEVNGALITDDSTLLFHVVDYDEMVDSTVTITVRLHHATATHLTDSATMGVDYEDYGFTVSAAESRLLRSTIDSLGYATLTLRDTLQTEYGCDSVVTLSLTFTAAVDIDQPVIAAPQVSIYPNPTSSLVNVVAEGMTHVELYDNEGRRLQNYSTTSEAVRIDLSPYASGIYYFRVHTPHSVSIHKVIKR